MRRGGRLAGRLDEDQRYSLIRHHTEQAGQCLAQTRPDLARLRRGLGRPVARAMSVPSWRRRHSRHAVLGFADGLGNMVAEPPGEAP
jgi:hypothetical protein